MLPALSHSAFDVRETSAHCTGAARSRRRTRENGGLGYGGARQREELPVTQVARASGHEYGPRSTRARCVLLSA
jgi:hypothetical protein